MRCEIVAHYGEVGTKGANRAVFESCLAKNIRSSLATIKGVQVRKRDQRFFVSVERADLEGAKERLARVFGIAWYAETETVPLSYPEMLKGATTLLESGRAPTTFRVSARRSNKSFAMNSQEVARKLGEDIVAALGLRVNLSSPETELFVEIVSDRAVLHTEKVRGPGGLPVGVTGRVLHLLSGGIDSPAAAWLMMKRGCRPVYLHFYLAPAVGSIVEGKMGELVRLLRSYGGGRRIILIPFAPYQLSTQGLPEDFEPTVFRYFMRLVAERLSGQMGFPAISTGDNLAQVASQTLHNLACIDHGSSVPTLRPLLGYDKEEIVQLAKRIGTYDTSLLEYKDCCSIVSRHPRTRMRWEYVEEAARRFAFPELASRCISQGWTASFEGDAPPTVEPLESLLAKYEKKRSVAPTVE